MKSKPFRFMIPAMLLLPLISYSQNIEKISFDAADSTNGYYLAVRPLSKNTKAVLVLLTSFTAPEALLPETKLHNVGYVNDVLTIVASTNRKLYADTTAVNRINAVLADVLKRFAADPSAFVLAGYDEAGGIALRYTELAYEDLPHYKVQPRAVFGIDTPVDLFGLWHWSENQIKKNYWPGAVGDARYYLDAMTKENGTIYNNAARYRQLTPFDKTADSSGNERYLQKVPVRLYYDADIGWQLTNRRNSFYDTKIPDASELVKRLLLAGNNQAELMLSAQPGLRSNGIRHPNSLSIVNEVECVQWIKKCVGIIDVNTWAPPYQLVVPAGWNKETFSLPPDFAPQLSYKGVEDIRFAAGWGDVKSEEHWAYAFLWWLEGSPRIDAATLQTNLSAYYDGLVSRNIVPRNIAADKIMPTAAAIKKTRTLQGDTETFNGTISMLDYHAQLPMVLNCLVHVKDSKTKDRQAILVEVSPKPFTHAVWQKLDEVDRQFKIKE